MSKSTNFNENDFGIDSNTINQTTSFGTQQQNPPPRSATGSVFTALADMHSITATGNTASGNTADVLKIFNEVQSRVQNKKNALNVKLIPIEHAQIYIASIAMYVKLDDILFYTVFLLEQIGKPVTSIQVPSQKYVGRTIDVDRDASNYWDATMQKVVEDTIRAAEHLSNDFQLSNTAAIVIHNRVDLTNANALAAFYDYGSVALSAFINRTHGQPTSKITGQLLLSDKSVNLVTKFDVTPGATYLSTTGQPIVGDFNAVLYVTTPTNNNAPKSLHGNNEDFSLTSIVGYLDFVRAEQQPVSWGGAGMSQRPAIGYDPVLVITQNTCLGKTTLASDSILTQLLALTTIVPLVDPRYNRWSTIFEPFIGDNRCKTSIGVLGLEHNPIPWQPYEPKILNIAAGGEPVFGNDKVTAQQVIATYVSQNLVVALDILHGGPLEWLQALLVKAKPGSAAEQVLIDELDSFSGNLFSTIWKPLNLPILAFDSTDIHAGYYTDASGVQRDIRSIDYLSVLEATQGDQITFAPFAEGFLPGTDNHDALDQKRKMLLKFAPHAIITGMYTRIFLNNSFINAIDQMNQQLGLNIAVEGLNDLNSQSNVRATFNSNYFSPIQSHGTFAAGFNRGYQPGNGGNRYGSTFNAPGTYGTGR